MTAYARPDSIDEPLLKNIRWKINRDPEGDRPMYGIRYWNFGKASVAIVACISREIDWAMYIGALPGDLTEIEVAEYSSHYGAKIDEPVARSLLPGVKERYRP